MERGVAAAVQDDAWITSGDEEEGRGRRKTKNYLQMSSWRAATGAHSQVIFSVLAAVGMGRGSAPFHSFRIVLALQTRLERDEHTHDISREISGQGNLASRRLTLDRESRNT